MTASVRLMRTQARPDLRLGAIVLGLSLLVYLGTAGGSLATTDAVVSYDLTRQIVEHQTLALSGNLIGNEAYRGADGRYYDPFGLAQSLWNVPFYVAGRAAAAVLPAGRIDEVSLTKATVALGSAVAAALSVYMVWLLAGAAGASPGEALLAALLAGFASSLWPYSKFGFSAPLASVFVTGAVLYALRAGTDGRPATLMAGGAMLGLAVLTRHEMALAALPLVVAVACGPASPWRRLSWWALGGMPFAALWMAYNAVRFGSPLSTGYERDPTPAFGSSIPAGLWGLLCSPGTSLLLYSPVVVPAVVALVALRRRQPRLAWLSGGLFVLFLVFYAELGNFAGGRSYGPRYLVPFVPLLCAGLPVWMSSLARGPRRIVIGLCLLSAAVQVPGVMVDFSKVRVAFSQAHPGRTYESVMNEWRYCPLTLNATATVERAPHVLRHLAGLEPRPPVVRAPTDARGAFSQQMGVSLDFWWMYLFYLGVFPAWLSVATGLAFAAGAVLLLRAGIRRARWLEGRAPAGVDAPALNS